MRPPLAIRAGLRLCAALLLLAATAHAGPYDTWATYKTITINTTNSGGGANVTSTQTTYPILIRLLTANASDVLSDALANGADVRFSSSDGATALPYQIESWGATEADIWVLVPSIAGNASTDIRIYWGKSGQTDASSASSVFTTGNNFQGVWHLGETSGSITDATSNGLSGTRNGNAASTTGAIGTGQTFDGTGDYFQTGAFNQVGFGTLFTASAWVYLSSGVASPGTLFSKGNDGTWSSQESNFYFGDNTTNSNEQGRYPAFVGHTRAYIAGNTAVGTDAWHQVTYVYNSTGPVKQVYIDGTSQTLTFSNFTGGTDNTGDLLFIGRKIAGESNNDFNGKMDELEISNAARSADWIKLNYQTQKSSQTAVTYSATAAPTVYWNRNAVLTSSTDFNKAYNWTTKADGTGSMAASGTDDDFTSDTKNAAWTMYDNDGYADTQTPYYSLTDNADQLTLRGRGSDISGATNQFVAAYRSDITGDFDVSVKMVSQSAADPWSKAGIMMADNIATLTNGGYAALSVTPSNGFHFQYDISGNVGELETFTSTGSVTFPCWLRMVKSGTSVTAYYRTATTSAWTQVGTAQTPQSTGANSQIALFVTSHTSSVTSTVVFDEFQGGTTLSSGLNLSFNGTSANDDANSTMSAAYTAASIDFTNYTGTFNFGSSTLSISTGDATFYSGMTVTAGTGTLAFTGTSGTQNFTPKSGATLPTITESGTGGTVLVNTNGLTTGAFTQSAGTWQWGTGLTHSIASISTSGGSMDFGSSTVQVTTGDANLRSLTAVTPGTGTLAMTGSSGIQVLTPPSGISLPAITSTGAATLQLSTNTLNCLSYAQTAGVLDFNGEDVTTTGNFTLTNGNASAFTNLTGRTLTVGGNASFAGSAGNLVDLNLGAWTITTAGTLTADYATIYGSDASGGSKGVATHSYNAKSNTNWLFSVPATLSNLTKSVRLNFNTTSSGANVSGNVVNFPLFLRFTSSNLTFSATSDSGTDLIFVDKDGTTLKHQVVEWDKPNQTGKVWVKVPQVDGNSATDYITLYYGCDSCTTNAYARSDSVFGVFKSVFHLNAPEAKAYDATTLANHGTFVSNLPNLANGGIVSKNAAVFDGSASSYIDVPNESNYDLTTNISVWAWIKVGTFNKAYQAIVTKGGGTFRLTRHNTTNFMYFACNKTGATLASGGAVNVNDGSWHLVVGTFAGDSTRLYVDGARDGTASVLTPSITTNDTDLYIGENAGGLGTGFNGDISEVRIGNTATALSSDFIKLSYETQKTTSTFLTAYTTASFQNSKTFKLNTTASGANIAADVTNFPVLIRLSGVTALAANNSGTTVPTDVRFLDGDGVTWLDYQIERWDRTGGIDSGEVWVRVPTVEGNYAGHSITMYYKQAASVSGTMADGQCASCVFQTSNNFIGDWHLNTSGTGARPDAVGSAGSLTTNNYSGSEFKGGVIAGADSLNGSNQYLSIASGLADWSNGFTYTGWAYWSSTATGARLFDFGNGSGVDNLYYGRQGTSTTSYAEIVNNTTAGGVKTATGAIATGVWGHFALTINGTALKLYKNGVLAGSGTSSQSLRNVTRTNNYLGKSNYGTDLYYQGKYDEIAIANVARDSNWIKLCYQNQRRDSTPLFNPSPSDFKYTQKLVFNTTKTGANVTGNVANYPMLVRLTGLAAYGVNGSGTTAPTDIRFLDGDGTTWLNYQVERWDRTGGIDSAEIWVLVPQVDGNSDHDFITLYYQANGVTVADGQCGSCVFSTSDSHTGVWHLSEETAGTGTASVYKDATGDAYHGTDMISATGRNGVIGRGHQFGSGNDYVELVASSNFLPATSTPVTLSTWFNATSFSGSAGGNRMFTITKSDSSATAFGLAASGVSSSNRVEPYINGNTVRGNTVLSTATWYHAAWTWDGSGTYKLYVNGSLDSTYSSQTLSFAGNTSTARIGIRSTNNINPWNGYFDEVRWSQTVRSADWIKLDYETQRATGNKFWNSRAGPNNKATLTATATSSSNISLSWSSAVSDSSKADSVGIWVKYSGYPDSVGSGSTFVAKLIKTDTTYNYPATYPTTYYFALAVRDTSGKWSPFTSASSDSATLVGVTMPDTIYVDSATGLAANSCASAQNPSTPKKTIKDALACGASATDTLVVRVMPGTYTDSVFSITTKPSIVTSFDNNSRAVMFGHGSGTLDGGARLWTLVLYGNMGIRNLDVKCLINSDVGVYVTGADNVFVEGCRIYNTASNNKHGDAIELRGTNNQHHIANNLIYQPIYYGILTENDNSFNVVNNVFVGSGGTTVGFSQFVNASATDATVSNNIFYNWGTGITSFLANIGSCSNNLFFGVTTGQNTTTTTCTGSVTADPLFANTTPTDRNAFKLLPGSPAIDAGTTTYGSGAGACTRRTPADYFGTARPLGTAPDIGLYEGTGYTPNPSGEFDTLAVTSTATTITVQNSKWKLIWDQARGAGITQFFDKVTSSANLLASNSLLFDAKIDSYTASSQTTAGPVLSLIEGTRARAVIRQRLPVSASLDLNIYYSVYSSGHVYIESELSNLAASTTTVGTVDYTLKLGTTTAAYTSAGTNNGFGYLTTSSRGALLSVTRNLDGGASGSETWATSTAASGSPGTVLFNTTDLANLSQNTVRRHDFLLYVGDNSLTFDKAAAINADAYTPSTLSMSAGTLIGERSWQDLIQGHWTFDDGAGSTARDKSVNNLNNATLGGANYKWTTGKVGGGVLFTTTDSAYVASTSVLNPANGFTVMFWLKPDFTMGDTALILSKGLSNANGWYCRKVTGVNKVIFTMGAATVTSPTLTDGAWTHIAVVADAGSNRQLEMYVNGVQTAASTAAATATSNSANLVFGYASGAIANAKFKGTLDDVRIYNRELPGSDVQSVYDFGFSSRYGHYALRADNNNRVVALINGGAAQTRVQPAFYISNWFGPRDPKYVFLNGTKLKTNVDYVVDSISTAYSGNYLTLQLNKILTGADQTLFIDDDDSTGFMGTATAMKSLTITSTSGKIAIKNFTDTVFSGASSGQWYMELGLKGWTTPTGTPSTTLDSGFGEIMKWKAAAVSPNVAVSSAFQLAGYSYKSGRVLSSLKLDATSPEMFASGLGYLSPATNTYTLVDSSSTRLSLTLSTDSLTGEGTAAVTKRFTFYPTGRVFVSYQVRNQSINFDTPRLDLSAGYDGNNATASWSTTTATANARWALLGGDLNFHPIGMAILSVKNATSTYSTSAALTGGSTFYSQQTGSSEQSALQFYMPLSQWTSANKPVTVNYMMDFSKKFADSATADSLLKDSQIPAVLTAITGTRVTNDALDFNADNFAEGDGAYTYAASSGIASFRFVNTVTSFYPAFRISSWTQGTLPDFVVLDNQVLTRGYHYNAYLNTASNEVVMQFNKTLAPGTHVFFISQKSGLAVKLNRFEATGGDGVDSLAWTTESEFENLGFYVWRRYVPSGAADSIVAKDSLAYAGRLAAAKASAGPAQAPAGKASAEGNAPDTLPSASLSSKELAGLGYVRITPKPIPGAQGGSSASTRDYVFLDRTATFGSAYQYLLEAVDFNGGSVFYGPRAGRPGNPFTTELLPNYPNPFNPITTLRFSLREKLKVSLIIYDSRGRVVRTLVRPDKALAAGKYSVMWDARNEGGIEAPSGQYFYRFTAGRYVKSRKMLLIK
ncbi:MAG: DUF2341 domain-containing protein [Fibrobacteres bacterium]|nr:DUF2341 domain-containing protein [Fibrobacterota bacterium]